MAICSKDCFHCPYPDCINDEMDAADYASSRAREKIINPPTMQARKRAASQRAYREAHKEEIAASHRAYREAHKEEIAASKRAYYEAHKDVAMAEALRKYLEEHGYTQQAFALEIGVTKSMVSHWVNARMPIRNKAVLKRLEKAYGAAV